MGKGNRECLTMGSRRSLSSSKEISGNATMHPAVPEGSGRIPLRDITNIVEALDRERLSRSSSLLPAETQNSTAEASAPQKPLASEQRAETGATLADASSTQPAETSVPSLPPMNVAHPSPEQSLRTATGASGSAARVAAARQRRPKKKPNPKALTSNSKKARRRRALMSMR